MTLSETNKSLLEDFLLPLSPEELDEVQEILDKVMKMKKTKKEES